MNSIYRVLTILVIILANIDPLKASDTKQIPESSPGSSPIKINSNKSYTKETKSTKQAKIKDKVTRVSKKPSK